MLDGEKKMFRVYRYFIAIKANNEKKKHIFCYSCLVLIVSLLDSQIQFWYPHNEFWQLAHLLLINCHKIGDSQIDPIFGYEYRSMKNQ